MATRIVNWVNYIRNYIVPPKVEAVVEIPMAPPQIPQTIETSIEPVKKFIPDELVTDVTKNINNGLNTVSVLREYLSDPLSLILMGLFGIFVYAYFTNDAMCQFFGLAYPAYHMYMVKPNKMDKVMGPIIKYFLIYTHIEFVSMVIRAFNIVAHHLKLALVICLIYLTEHRLDWLNALYDRMVHYDRIAYTVAKRFKDEFYKVSAEINSDVKRGGKSSGKSNGNVKSKPSVDHQKID